MWSLKYTFIKINKYIYNIQKNTYTYINGIIIYKYV